MQMEVERLKEKRDKLASCEHDLDQQCTKIRQCLHNIVDDPGNNKYPIAIMHKE